MRCTCPFGRFLAKYAARKSGLIEVPVIQGKHAVVITHIFLSGSLTSLDGTIRELLVSTSFLYHCVQN